MERLYSIRKLELLTLVLVILLSCFRLAHIHLLWADEDYHLAAAIHILHGKFPYRDFWYDKPPLSAVYYLLVGGYSGWPLRILDAAYIVTACALTFRLASAWWTKTEGVVAAVLLAFYTTFYLPSAVIPFAADALMLVPHVAAVYFAYRRKPLASGFCCAAAIFVNTKAAFVAVVCLVWLIPEWLTFCSAFVVTSLVGVAWLFLAGAWPGYWEQVWSWGFRYAAGAPVTHPIKNGVLRTLNWAGFHVAVVMFSAAAFRWFNRRERILLGSWTAASFAAVALGSRFAPHYFLQLLPPLVVAGARGIVLAMKIKPRLTAALCGLMLALPMVRFGPRYVMLVWDNLRSRPTAWRDVAMDLDSQGAAAFINARKRAGDTLLVWGYRPDLYVYTRLTSDSLFWDSQPLTGVAADRHLSATTAIYSRPAELNRRVLTRSHPVWIVDGLGLMNPQLRPEAYPELKEWLKAYELVGRTQLCLVYRRKH